MIYERIANKRLNFTIYNSSLPFLIPTRHFNKYSIINQMNANYEEVDNKIYRSCLKISETQSLSSSKRSIRTM
jgi:hypothetical protein